jgi:hypothetical protein
VDAPWFDRLQSVSQSSCDSRPIFRWRTFRFQNRQISVPLMSVASAGAMFPLPNLPRKVWEDPSLFKWRKREPHVPLRSHDTPQGSLPAQENHTQHSVSSNFERSMYLMSFLSYRNRIPEVLA